MNAKTIQQSVFLYVEDNESNRTVIQLLLQKAMKAKELVMFENSSCFLERVKALPECPDVFLLDIHVKPYDGFEMLAMLRADPQYRDAKVIALTASVMSEEVKQLRDSRFDGAIGKPLRTSTFPDLLARILNGEAVWSVS